MNTSNIPGTGDDVIIDFSNDLCSGTSDLDPSPRLAHHTLFLQTSSARFRNVIIRSTKKCPTNTRVDESGVLNANSVVVEGGAHLILLGAVQCNTFTLEKDGLIQGGGSIVSESEVMFVPDICLTTLWPPYRCIVRTVRQRGNNSTILVSLALEIQLWEILELF